MRGLLAGFFTTMLAPESRAFSGALKIEKLKAPLIPGTEGAVDTNDWCIKQTRLYICIMQRIVKIVKKN